MTSLDKIREDLTKRLEILTTRAGKVERNLRRRTNTDSEERAQEIQNDEVLEDLDEHARSEIDQIRAALARIENGTFGDCNECGEEIGGERLAALPFTGLCIDCAERADTSA
ncbi:MAG: TraR/DksA family transcriptional regulator [bacterium]|nr:TraR/DksA family transcriptional regulator [bacterium]MCP5043075.1 TraR/DksA family transcriptional regulator [bacterium]